MPTIAKVCSAILNTRLNKYLTENELPLLSFFLLTKWIWTGPFLFGSSVCLDYFNKASKKY